KPEFFNSNGPLRGTKRDLYEGGIRVPMIARWPGRIAPGGTCAHISAFWDVLPTFADIAGVQKPEGIDGISFAAALLGRPQQQHEYLYWEFHEGSSKQAVRMGDWKAVRPAPSRPIELYNLTSDIGEEDNVADKHPDIVAKAEEIISKARTDADIWPLKDKAE
ncbi:MAG: sulfatase/phosphatase domain-containing protein, partial [Planctomycetota bacterium]